MINNTIGYIICEAETSRPESMQLTPKTINGKLVGKGILQTADEKNRNGRWYSKEKLFPALKAPRVLEVMRAGDMRAEAGHPLDTNLQRQSNIMIPLSCARHLQWWTDGNDVWGEFVATNNDLGKEFDADLREGVLPAWSLRALGSVKSTNRGAEVENITIITYDRVIYPSHTRAYTKEIVSESTYIDADKPNIIECNGYKNDLCCEASVLPINNQSIINYLQSESGNLKFIKECFDFAYSNIQTNESGTKVILTDKASGDTLVINMESYVHNELMTYASDMMNKYRV